MTLEMNQLRFALDEYDRADEEHKDEFRHKLLALVTVGLLRNLLAAHDDALVRLRECIDQHED
jgi:hypothetical protein